MKSYRVHENDGFMGNTHALSVVAIVLSFSVIFPSFFFSTILPKKDLITMLVGLIIAIGAGLLPDLDNTKSSAISTLGIIGVALSSFMRFVSEFIYSISHTNKEPETSNPHRGFWHTLAAGVIFGLFTMFLMSFNASIFKINKITFTVSTIILFIYLLIAFELMLTAFFKKFISKEKNKNFGIITLWLIGFVFSSIMILLLLPIKSLSWVGFMVMIGWTIHIMGDTITTSGTPILWPIKHNGKRWWSYRLPPYIHADGPVEHKIIFPIFVVISIIMTIILITRGV